MRASIGVAALALACVVGGCGSSTPKCTPGMSIMCTGPGGCMGGQVCSADGTYGACVCGDAGMPVDGGVDTGTPDTGPMDAGVDAGIDAGPVDMGVNCNPIFQTGCLAGERCTWAHATGAETMGHEVCTTAPATVHALQPCTIDPTTGIDDCASGFACGSGSLCAPVCDTTGATPSGYACEYYGDFFVDMTGMHTHIGIGTPTCDPITQTRTADGAARCGSSGTSMLGCYGAHGGPYTCALAGPAANTQGATPAGGGPMSPFLNGCAPGFIPMSFDTGSTFVCTAYCTPATTTSESPSGAPGVAPHDCTAAGASFECRYDNFVAPMPTADGNMVGVCFDPTPSASPSCTTISMSDPSTTTWGCSPATVP